MKMATQKVMQQVLVALLPGVIALTFFLGAGILINLIIAVVTALITETLMLRLRAAKLHGVQTNNSILSPLQDCSVIVTAALLALCLPPYLPIWLVITGVLFAVIFGKHIYGGLGHNLFNPAMVGFAALILSYPYAMSQWPSLTTNSTLANTVTVLADSQLGFQDLVLIKLGALSIPDGITAATPLDVIKFRGSQTIDEVWLTVNGFDGLAGAGWGWINIAFLLGGLYLLKTRVIQYRAPLAMLIAITVLSALFYDSGSSESFGSPLFHLLSGGTMFAAFFIVTDPVTSPGGKSGQWAFGIGVGVITFIIRTTGAYPEGFAFAILLMNGAAPLIDRLRLTPPALLSKAQEQSK
jgi:electron transport complex protein RnfD